MNLPLRLIQLLLRHRLIAGLLLLISVLAAGYSARHIKVRFQYKDFYEYAGNERLPLLDRYTEEFGDPGGFVVLLIDGPDVFTPEVLGYVDSVTRQLEASGEFLQVRSLANAHSIRASGDAVESGLIQEAPPTTQEQAEAVRRAALTGSLLVRRIVSPDSTATAVLAEMKKPAVQATIPEQSAAVEVAKRVMHGTPPPAGVRVQVTGSPVVEVETTRALVRDQTILTPAVLIILVTALALTFRSIHGIVLPLSSVLVSTVWTAGFFALLGRPVDIISSTIPTVLLVYAVVDPIFVYTRFLDKLALSRTREEAVIDAMRELLLPCFLTSLTTALGFAAFMSAALPMIKYFGLVVAVGVLLAFVTTVTVLPLLLVSVDSDRLYSEKPRITVATENLMASLWQLIRRKPELLVGLALSLLIAGGGAARGMHIANEYVGLLPKGVVQDGVRMLEQRLSGVSRIAIYLQGEPDAMKRPDVLQAIDKLDRFAEQLPSVTSSLSLADIVSDTNRAFLGGDPAEQRVPDSESLISQYLSLVDPGDLSDFANSEFSHTHIRVLVSDHGSKVFHALTDQLQHEADRLLLPLGVRADITGFNVLAGYATDDVVKETIWGFVYAFAIIIVVQLAMFRSLRIALISIIPNLVPICVCLLLMRALGWQFRVDNSLVLCISVGGLFNTTIHIVARVVQQLRAGVREPDVNVGRALASVGPPSLYTAVILSMGLMAMTLSRFPGLQMLGILCLVTLMAGFAADAALTTSFLQVFLNWGSLARKAAPANRVSDLASLAPGNTKAVE